jgi:hypothetical protein
MPIITSRVKYRAGLLLLLMTCFGLLGPAGLARAAGLRPGHPRLMLTKEEVAERKALMTTDAFMQQQFEDLQKSGEDILKREPLAYVIDNDRLLDVSREALARISVLGALYQLDGDPKWAAGARANLLAVAAFPDWHPVHFLDTAEMALAVALGYDWIFDRLSAADRATIRQALVAKGLDEGLYHYKRGTWWTQSVGNWGQVCNGGLGVAALALADEEKTKAELVLGYVEKNMPQVMKLYAPDGGGAEGLTYWNYGTRYNAILLSATKTALDTDYGLSQQPGFRRTAEYRIHMISPINNANASFNYGDQNESVFGAPVMLWLANQFNNPFYARTELERKGAGGLWGLLWYEPKFAAPAASTVPLNAVYGGIEVASLRSAWNDPNAFFVGFKGGDNGGSHAHLDIGSFVFDALGERWGLDLGIESQTYVFANASRKYTYYLIGFPFLQDLGRRVYEYENRRKRRFKADLSEFR